MNTKYVFRDLPLRSIQIKYIGRFWRKVNITDRDSCWEWMCGKNKTGYGLFNINSQNYLAHRIAYTLLRGDIPRHICVCHTCDNPGCVNPGHLFLGTHKENMEDCWNKGRGYSGGPKLPLIGSKNHQAKLSEDNVIEIRLLAQSGVRRDKMALDYGVTVTTICRVINRVDWKHV